MQGFGALELGPVPPAPLSDGPSCAKLAQWVDPAELGLASI